jgi:hypothetical protein
MALYLVAVIPASLAEDLGNVLALTGAIGGSSLCYLGPGAVYLGIHGERFLQLVDESSWLGAWHKQQTTTQIDTRLHPPNGETAANDNHKRQRRRRRRRSLTVLENSNDGTVANHLGVRAVDATLVFHCSVRKAMSWKSHA